MILETIIKAFRPEKFRELEKRTKKLKTNFLGTDCLSKDEVFHRLRQSGFIGDDMWGFLKGHYFLKVVHPLKEPGMITGYYFYKDNCGKYHLTYAGGMGF